MKLILTGPRGTIGRIITKITWTDVSHVAIQVGEYIYEAKGGEGVIKTYWRDWNTDYVLYEYNITGLDEERVRQRLEKQVGKGYDFLALLCYPFRCDYKRDINRWTCSELIAWALRELIPHIDYHRMAPRHFKLLGHALEEYKNGS